MTRKFTFTILAMLFAILGPGAEAWGQANYSGTFTRITSADDFATGYYVVTGAGTTKALGNTANSNKRIEGVDVTINENSITNPSNSVVYYITRTENTCTFQNVGNSKYMYQAATTSGKGMGFQDNSANITFEGWTSGGTGTSAYEGFAFTLNGTSNNKLKYNKSSAWFANYANDYSNTMLPVNLYKLATNSPTCTIDPTSHDFGEITVGENATFDFIVTTANLTEDLTLAVSEGFSVSPETIESTETETTVTVTCAPTAVGALDGTLTISGGGLTENVTATLSATGLCTAPENELAYTTPVELQLTAGEAEATLAPIENTGNGGTITYELIAGDESHLSLDESTGEIYTDAIGSYTVRATQAVNGTICGGTFDIEINVTSTSPSCSISPSEWDFGNVAIGTPASKTFTVTTANLTGDLTVDLSMGETTYSVTPTTISQSATSTDVTVTFTPVEDGLVEELLTISGGGLTSAVEVVLSATGISPYTVTYVAVNGDAPQAAIVEQGSSITLGTVENVDCNTWQFAGWSESESSTVAPTLLAGAEYTPEDDVTLYAVYEKGIGDSDSFEYVFANQGYTNAQTVFNDVMDETSGIGWAATKGGSNDPKYYDAGTGLRVYNGGSFSVTANGNTITNVTLTFASNDYTFNSDDTNPTTWSGSQSTDISWSVSRTCRLQKVNVTYSNTSYSYTTNPDCQTPVATPTIRPNGGEFFGSQEITLECTTEDATISYTTDDWATSSTYSAPFTITETTTIKVKATKDGMSESEEVSATFTKVPVLETIQEIFDASATAGNYYVKLNNWVVSGVKGSNAYVTDGTKGFIVYKSGHEFEVGNILSGTAQLALTRYNGAAEFTNLTSTTEGISVTTGGTITPTEVSIADLSGVNTGAVIIASNVIYTGSDIFSDGTNTIKAYNTFMTLPSFTNGDSYNLTGVYIQYNTTKEIAPRSAADIQLIVAAPTFTPEGGNYNAAQTVTITSATTGATIYYTLDGSDPTVESTLYSAPIELTSNTTLKAIAAKAGSVSEIATAVYTITITTVATPTFEPEDGSYFNESLEVSLDCATDGATIVYTTDNWATSANYTAPFTITETTTVKAKATKAAMDESEIAEATYTKRYKVDYVVNGNGSLFEPKYVTPSSAIGTLPTPGDEYIPTGFGFAGWSLSESSTTTIGETYIVDADVTLYAVFSKVEGGTQGSGNYEKVTENLEDWSGEYLLVYEGDDTHNAVAWTGVDDASCGETVTITSNTIAEKPENAVTLTIAPMDGGYSIMVNDGDNDGKYISGKSGSNTINFGVNPALNTLSFDENNSINITSNTSVMRYNNASNNERFRYFKGTSYSSQKPVYLYKKDEGTPGNTKYYTRVQSISGNTEITTVTTADLITVPNGAVLTITGSCTGDPENLIIEDGGQLIVNNKGVQATMKKHIKNTPSRDDQARSWYTISSPLAASVNVTDVYNLIPNSVTDTNYDLYRLNEAEGIWENARPETDQEPAFTTIDKGCGYIYSNTNTTDIAFAGEVNVTNVECTLTNDAAHGFNLIGNPFSQNIKLTDVTGVTLADGFYVLNNDNTWETMIEAGTIAPLQGFLVQVDGDGGTATISKPTSSSKGERSNEQNTNIEIIVSNGSYRDNAYAMFGEGTGLNKVNHRNAEAPMLYIPQDGEDFAIAFMDENTTIFPVSFKAMTTGSYSISLKATDDVSTLVLVDNMTGAETNMLFEDSYTFIGSPADNENRFTVKLKISNSQDKDEHFAYQNGSELVVNGEGTLQIFDILGRVVISEEVHGQTVNVGGLNTGAYIVRLTGESVKTQKIVVR